MFGAKPFSDVQNNEVCAQIEKGERLPFPPNAPQPLLDLMSTCWTYEPLARPDINHVKSHLK